MRSRGLDRARTQDRCLSIPIRHQQPALHPELLQYGNRYHRG